MWAGMKIPGGTLLVSELNWHDIAQALCQMCVCVHVCNDVCTCFYMCAHSPAVTVFMPTCMRLCLLLHLHMKRAFFYVCVCTFAHCHVCVCVSEVCVDRLYVQTCMTGYIEESQDNV